MGRSINPRFIALAGEKLELDKPRVMGILNVTPDSFSDGGNFLSVTNALQHAEAMLAQGADIIDVGGESTRPNAEAVSEQEELSRVIPIIKAIKSAFNPLISIDSSKANVIHAAISEGASLVNDVRALREPEVLHKVAGTNAGICLMHMQGQPRTMQANPEYNNVVDDVNSFLMERVEVCLQAGIGKDRIIIDPGFGFGKSLRHNLLLLKELNRITSQGFPVLVGLSRKSMFEKLLGLSANERLAPSIAAAVISVANGASIVRVHDVKETVEALKVFSAVDSVQQS